MENGRSQLVAVFTPDQLASISRAYAEALGMIAGEEPHEELREKLAEHMMFLARNGETDEERLRRLSIIAVLGHVVDRPSGLIAPAGATGRG